MSDIEGPRPEMGEIVFFPGCEPDDPAQPKTFEDVMIDDYFAAKRREWDAWQADVEVNLDEMIDGVERRIKYGTLHSVDRDPTNDDSGMPNPEDY